VSVYELLNAPRRLQCTLTVLVTAGHASLAVTMYLFCSYTCNYLVTLTSFFMNKVSKVQTSQLLQSSRPV